jgi:hypothetical protein
MLSPQPSSFLTLHLDNSVLVVIGTVTHTRNPINRIAVDQQPKQLAPRHRFCTFSLATQRGPDSVRSPNVHKPKRQIGGTTLRQYQPRFGHVQYYTRKEKLPAPPGFPHNCNSRLVHYRNFLANQPPKPIEQPENHSAPLLLPLNVSLPKIANRNSSGTRNA